MVGVLNIFFRAGFAIFCKLPENEWHMKTRAKHLLNFFAHRKTEKYAINVCVWTII